MNSNKACPVCKGGTKRPGATTFTADLGFGVVVVRDVPAEVCDLCGEEWIDDSVAAQLEKIIDQAKIKHPFVKVANWHDEIRALAS